VAALRRRADVASSRLLIGGQSRGGVLSVAYAGRHPEDIEGVINFVGGWVGDRCSTAAVINQTLFKQGARFGRRCGSTVGRIHSTRSRTARRILRPSGRREDKAPSWISRFLGATAIASLAIRPCGPGRPATT
jgi:pimeloyl-ACP methyl ester carboxylesterase